MEDINNEIYNEIKDVATIEAIIRDIIYKSERVERKLKRRHSLAKITVNSLKIDTEKNKHLKEVSESAYKELEKSIELFHEIQVRVSNCKQNLIEYANLENKE